METLDAEAEVDAEWSEPDAEDAVVGGTWWCSLRLLMISHVGSTSLGFMGAGSKDLTGEGLSANSSSGPSSISLPGESRSRCEWSGDQVRSTSFTFGTANVWLLFWLDPFFSRLLFGLAPFRRFPTLVLGPD